MKVYMLRVGADQTKIGGGFRSIVKPDLSYIFIPIPEPQKYRDGIDYREYEWFGEHLPDRLREKLGGSQVHNDPEFRGCSYGSPKWNKRKSGRSLDKNYRKLCDLREGDVVVFYGGFECPERNREALTGLYAFGYFRVKQPPVWYTDPSELKEHEKKLVRHNLHFKVGSDTTFEHRKDWFDQIIVVGERSSSRVFSKLVPLSTYNDGRMRGNYYPCKKIRALLRYGKSLNMSSLRDHLMTAS